MTRITINILDAFNRSLKRYDDEVLKNLARICSEAWIEYGQDVKIIVERIK